MGFLNGTLRQLEVAASDAAFRFSYDDPLDAWDPAYIEETLPAIGMWTERYFRGEVEGLENIPTDEPVLLVGNHSGGTLIADTFVLAHAFYKHFGPQQRYHQLAHDLVFKAPGIRELVRRYGTVPANPENMRAALERKAALLVYPGGDHESYRPSWEANQVDFDGRSGFVRLALELGVRVVPVVAIGGQETALFLGRGRRVSRALGLDKSAARLKVFPVQFAPPFGFTVLDLPMRLPLPAKIKVRVLEPLDLREALGPRPDVREGYEMVTGRLQESLDELAEERTLPVLG
jgi:1-acyl-sn-glycerol-3-phosphate acyltransferase